LTYDDASVPLHAMTTKQQLITMDKTNDDEDKIGGYDNQAAMAFFDKYKNGGDGTNDPTKYVVTTLGSGMPSAVSLLIGKVAHVTQQSMNQLPERPNEGWFTSITANRPGLFISSLLGTQNKNSRVQWLATSSEGKQQSWWWMICDFKW
jgi:hypothetical protein